MKPTNSRSKLLSQTKSTSQPTPRTGSPECPGRAPTSLRPRSLGIQSLRGARRSARASLETCRCSQEPFSMRSWDSQPRSLGVSPSAFATCFRDRRPEESPLREPAEYLPGGGLPKLRCTHRIPGCYDSLFDSQCVDCGLVLIEPGDSLQEIP